MSPLQHLSVPLLEVNRDDLPAPISKGPYLFFSKVVIFLVLTYPIFEFSDYLMICFIDVDSSVMMRLLWLRYVIDNVVHLRLLKTFSIEYFNLVVSVLITMANLDVSPHATLMPILLPIIVLVLQSNISCHSCWVHMDASMSRVWKTFPTLPTSGMRAENAL
jgi:hypothetical protein